MVIIIFLVVCLRVNFKWLSKVIYNVLFNLFWSCLVVLLIIVWVILINCGDDDVIVVSNCFMFGFGDVMKIWLKLLFIIIVFVFFL